MEQKVALITGSARRRLGWHVADALGRRGYAIVIHYNTSAAEAESGRRRISQPRHASHCSSARTWPMNPQVRRLVDETLKQFGRIDVLVNCAAIWKSKRLEEVTAADVRSYFDTNTLGTFLCCQHAGLAMVKQPEGGSIVTFGDWAIERPYMNYAAYFPSKGAIPALTALLCRRAGHSQSTSPRQLHHARSGDDSARSFAGRNANYRSTPRWSSAKAGPRMSCRPCCTSSTMISLPASCLPVDGGRTMYSSDSAANVDQ